MKLIRKYATFFILSGAGFLIIATLASCSMYKNAGRKNFESNAPGQIQAMTVRSTNNSATKMMSTSDSTTCWQQPANEPLWFDTMGEVDEDVSLTVRKINTDEIEVCSVDSED